MLYQLTVVQFSKLNSLNAILRHNGVEVGKKDYLGPMPYKN